MIVHTRDLRELAEMLLNHLEETGQASVRVDWDYYWFVPREVAFDPYSKPCELSLGQISDDWSTMTKVLSGELPPVGLTLVEFGMLLRAVGEAARE
ncbi:MAG: hypothetical protein IPJ17_11455 [Holophagales bacterium]|nr:MAG: hypothetical protein IPJ17_11455 [Holophagales bacterium]